MALLADEDLKRSENYAKPVVRLRQPVTDGVTRDITWRLGKLRGEYRQPFHRLFNGGVRHE